MDLVTRLAVAGIKHGTSGARTSLGLVAGNKRAMNALGDVPGAQGLVRGADGFLNPNKARNQKSPSAAVGNGNGYGHGDEGIGQDSQEGKKVPPPPPEKKKGLLSGKVGFIGRDEKTEAVVL